MCRSLVLGTGGGTSGALGRPACPGNLQLIDRTLLHKACWGAMGKTSQCAALPSGSMVVRSCEVDAGRVHPLLSGRGHVCRLGGRKAFALEARGAEPATVFKPCRQMWQPQGCARNLPELPCGPRVGRTSLTCLAEGVASSCFHCLPGVPRVPSGVQAADMLPSQCREGSTFRQGTRGKLSLQ